MSKVTSSALAGATRYEFKMQARRKALWILTALFFAVTILLGSQGPWQFPNGTPVAQIIATWTSEMQTFMPIAFGLLLADRLPRDRRLRADELLDSLSGSSAERWLGKYIGATLATLLPLFLVYLAGVIFVAVDRGSPEAILLGLAMFVFTSLPGLLFVAAFSVSCPVVIWAPLYQFLFTGYWFWGNLLNPNSPIPTISGTWLTPYGDYMMNGFFGHIRAYWDGTTVWEGLASAGLLLGLAALALYCAYRLIRFQQARQ